MIASQDAEALSVGRGIPADVVPASRERRGRRRALAVRSDRTVIALRQGLTALTTALTVLTVARCLGAGSFGTLAAGAAAFALGLGLADAGFSLLLVRELAEHPQDELHLMAVSLRAQRTWCAGLAVLLAVAGAIAMGSRGLVMIVLAPALALGGVSVTRQIVAVRSRPAQLLRAEVWSTLLLCATMVALAIGHAAPVLLAANLSLWTCLGGIPGLLGARRHVRPVRVTREEARAFTRRALPLGLAGTIPWLSLLLGLTLLGWLLPMRAVGHYAAALGMLMFVVALSGVLIAGRARALADGDRDRFELARAATPLARAVLLVAVPMAFVIALLARPLIHALLGSPYLAAVPAVQTLMLAADLTCMATAAAIVAVSVGLARRQLLIGGCGALVGAAGTVAIASARGPVAEAWVALASQGIIAVGGLAAIRRRVDLGTLARGVWRSPAPLEDADRHPGASAPVAAAAIVASIPALRADPGARPRPSRPSSASASRYGRRSARRGARRRIRARSSGPPWSWWARSRSRSWRSRRPTSATPRRRPRRRCSSRATPTSWSATDSRGDRRRSRRPACQRCSPAPGPPARSRSVPGTRRSSRACSGSPRWSRVASRRRSSARSGRRRSTGPR